MARDAPGAPLSSLASSSTSSYFSASPRPRPPDDDDGGLVELRALALLDVAVGDHGARRSRPCRARRWSRPRPRRRRAGSAANDFGRISDEVRAAAGERGLDEGGAAEDRLGGDEAVAVDLEVDVVGEHRAVELDRQAAGDVAAVVARAEQDGVGGVAALDGGGDGARPRARPAARRRGRRWRSTLVAPCAPSVGGDGVGVAADVDGLDGVGELAGLGQQLERGGRRPCRRRPRRSTQILERAMFQCLLR